ncbi:SDR family NAD(P)-dependent oxidoreductase [Nocardioides pocheonensis]|uniref:SDR family oxidoreductase n=1 Tax=Nocardioides pocheonensis TaxID=661485 RepID=A0A3N0GY79_9ACTN|nr:SDR family oxidoreductase [Nocardioides pocheonensis]RNM17407.1 SDR family oxidoreductase [Nocardioides pocheonensis]
MDHRTRDKVVVLTGATGGLGRATAERLADEGARLVLTDLDEQACKQLATSIAGHPAGHLTARLDVADELAWNELAATVLSACGRLDALVNNAGIGSLATVEDETLEHWETVMSVDSTGVWLGMKHLGPLIATSGGGSIVNLSSILGTVGGFGNSAAYHAAKGAVRTLTKNAALHWASSGVRVNSVHPGFIGTPELLERYAGTPRHDAMLANTPVGRLGRGEEIAAVVAFLVSDDSTFVTGSELYADGGYTAR